MIPSFLNYIKTLGKENDNICVALGARETGQVVVSYCPHLNIEIKSDASLGANY